jgi:PhnB protein
MARKRRSRPSTRTSTRTAKRGSGRKGAASSRGKTSTSAKRGKSRRSRRKPGPSFATRVKRTARKVLFGSLGVAGYVSDVARRRARETAGKARDAVRPIPDGYHTVTPYLIVRDVPRLIDFLRQAFGATEMMRAPRPDGSIMHAEVEIGDSRVMMGEASASSPPMTSSLHLYVVDTDALYHLALQAGATSLREPTDQFYGDRMAGVRDPLGNHWWIATHTENVSPEEIARRAATAVPLPDEDDDADDANRD